MLGQTARAVAIRPEKADTRTNGNTPSSCTDVQIQRRVAVHLYLQHETTQHTNSARPELAVPTRAIRRHPRA